MTVLNIVTDRVENPPGVSGEVNHMEVVPAMVLWHAMTAITSDAIIGQTHPTNEYATASVDDDARPVDSAIGWETVDDALHLGHVQADGLDHTVKVKTIK